MSHEAINFKKLNNFKKSYACELAQNLTHELAHEAINFKKLIYRMNLLLPYREKKSLIHAKKRKIKCTSPLLSSVPLIFSDFGGIALQFKKIK